MIFFLCWILLWKKKTGTLVTWILLLLKPCHSNSLVWHEYFWTQPKINSVYWKAAQSSGTTWHLGQDAESFWSLLEKKKRQGCWFMFCLLKVWRINRTWGQTGWHFKQSTLQGNEAFVCVVLRCSSFIRCYSSIHSNYGLSSSVANGGPAPHYQGSDSNSSASSLSSSTPLSSLSGLSQVLFPPVFGSEMVDVAISTEDRSRRPSSAERTADTAMQTDPHPPSYPDHPSPNGSVPDRLVSTETSRTVGSTVLLKDTVIHGKGEGPREMGGAGEGGRGRTRMLSTGDQEVAKHSPKTAALMALSRPRKPIRRSQSHITVSGETYRLTGMVKRVKLRMWVCF